MVSNAWVAPSMPCVPSPHHLLTDQEGVGADRPGGRGGSGGGGRELVEQPLHAPRGSNRR
jgi:hypothetical protein